MGNKISCTNVEDDLLHAYGHTPYSKQISKNMVRFWSELFLLAQDSSQASTSTCKRHGPKVNTKWQLVVPKLVPVNMVRVQDNPVTVTHLTAYNTKVDKIMDVIISFPGVELYRGSECFIYWTDPQKGLTWGLNLITPDDANYFVDLVTRQQNPNRSSEPGSPDTLSAIQKRVVKFADQISHPHTSRSLIEGDTFSRQSTPQRHMPVSAPGVDSMQMYVTGQRLSGWNVILPPDEQQSSSSQFNLSTSQSIIQPNLSQPSPYQSQSSSQHQIPRISLRSSKSKEMASSDVYDIPIVNKSINANPNQSISGVWQQKVNQNETECVVPVKAQSEVPELLCFNDSMATSVVSQSAKSEADQPMNEEELTNQSMTEGTMNQSLDSAAIRRMLHPLPITQMRAGTGTVSEIVLQQKGQVFTTKIEIPPRPSIGKHHRSGAQAPSSTTTSTSRTSRSLSKHTVDGSSSSLSSVENSAPPGVMQRSTILTPRTAVKRASLHLVSGTNGNVKSLSASNNTMSTSTQLESQHSSMSSIDHLPPTLATNNMDNRQKTRKTGFLLFKRWLGRQQTAEGSFVVLNNEPWHQYWARLKGHLLLLYKATPGNSELSDTSSTNGADTLIKYANQSQPPNLTVDLNCSLVQAMPEYPRRSYVFCVSTAAGQAYLLQCTSEPDLESWAQSIHTAAAFAFAKSSNKDAATRMLKREMEKLDQRMDSVTKMLSLQHVCSVSAVSAAQLAGWERELELLQTSHYLYKCYVAAIRAQEEPSCKFFQDRRELCRAAARALSAACAETKRYLSGLGVFTMSAVHSYLMSRIDPAALPGTSHNQIQINDSLSEEVSDTREIRTGLDDSKDNTLVRSSTMTKTDACATPISGQTVQNCNQQTITINLPNGQINHEIVRSISQKKKDCHCG